MPHTIADRFLPIFFVHVPKSAGTSVFTFLRSFFEERDVCPLPSDGIWRLPPKELPGFRLYGGHFSVDFIDQMGYGGTRLVMMRHPLSRVISLYDYWRSYRWEFIRNSLPPLPNNGPAIAKAGDLTNFLNTTSPFALQNLVNPVARQLLGSKYDTLAANEDAAIAECQTALSKFSWIGITELFGPSVAVLADLLGAPQPASLPMELSTYAVGRDDPAREPVERSQPSEDVRQRILTANRIDLALYEHGRTLLEREMVS